MNRTSSRIQGREWLFPSMRTKHRARRSINSELRESRLTEKKRGHEGDERESLMASDRGSRHDPRPPAQ